MMKKYIIYLGVAVSLLAASCRKEYKEIGEEPSKIEGITANWSLSSCSIIDKAATVEETMDVTAAFSRSSRMPNIRFTMEGGQGSYSTDTSGVAYLFFGNTTAGKWMFDNAAYPTKVIITPSGNTESMTFPLAATIRPSDTYLKIDKPVLCNGVEKSVYRLTFVRN
jgi:hypothetical protein